MAEDYTILSGIVVGACGGFAAGIALSASQWLIKIIKERSDKKTLYNWLVKNSNNTEPDFRSTRVLASYNNMTEDRVRYICCIHPLIHLSVGDKPDMWSVIARTPKAIVPRVRTLSLD